MINGLLFVICHAIINFIHHPNSMIVAQFFTIAVEKVPIEVIERAGIWSTFLVNLIAAPFAVVGHLVYVGSA